MNDFLEIWPADLHDDPDQVKRRLNSEKIKNKMVDLDSENKTALIEGSEPEPYSVSLDECTCFDFLMRGKPCKHIYKLADSLGILPPWPWKNDTSTQAELERWRFEFKSGNISPLAYVKISEALRKGSK